VIGFVQKINNVGFAEAVEFLADRIGLHLRYTDDSGGNRPEPGLRLRILEANRLAAEYYTDQLLEAGAVAGRQFLADRGFDREVAERFGVGFAPRGGHDLSAHLRGMGFTDAELVRAGLVRESGWDFFQGRLLWPIRDAGRSVLGFGARRLFDDDRMPAKYLNTPETPVYRKSTVLYGLDLARANIAKRNQAVIVEGYTDVMAAHLSGVDTAVASCGTAFGDDHARLLQRLIGSSGLGGEVIFTFDGDSAGQAAALKVFKGDQNFIQQTYVAVEPTGLDPCDLRLQHGDAAVRELVARRVPLYRFVMRNVVDGFDLDRVDGRIAALRAAAPLISSIRDASLVPGYVRELAQLLGMDPDEVRAEVKRSGRMTSRRPEPVREPDAAALPGLDLPDPRDRRFETERGTLRLLVKAPEMFAADLNGLRPDDFAHPTYRALFGALAAAAAAGLQKPNPSDLAGGDPVLEQLVVVLATERLLREATPAYATEHAAGVRLLATAREIQALKSKLQRTNPVEDPLVYNRMFASLVDLEARRKTLLALAAGPAM
jgi:DNA primase